MKLLHIINDLSSAGAQRALYNILAGGLAERFESKVISLQDEGRYGYHLKQLGVDVCTLNMKRRLPSPKILFKLYKIVRNFNPDIIQGWMYHGNIAASFAKIAASDNSIVLWNIRHSLYDIKSEKLLTRLIIRLNRSLSKKADCILYNSQISLKQHNLFGFESSHGHVVPNGFNINKLTPNKTVYETVRNKLNIPDNTILVGHVARFHPMKDHIGFLKAAVRVLRKYPETIFMLIGEGVSKENSALSDVIPHNLKGQFILLGEREDVQELIQAIDVLCLNSTWGEAFPNVIGEAMASGVPCISTDIGDSANIIGDTGYIIPPKTPEVLAKRIMDIITMSKTKRKTLGMHARERIVEYYAIQKIVDKYYELYKQLANNKEK